MLLPFVAHLVKNERIELWLCGHGILLSLPELMAPRDGHFGPLTQKLLSVQMVRNIYPIHHPYEPGTFDSEEENMKNETTFIHFLHKITALNAGINSHQPFRVMTTFLDT
jgi:hypothetical protein